MFLFVIAGVFLISLIAITAAAYFIKKTNWSPLKKKGIFTTIATFILFPVLSPVGLIVVIPAPNIVFLALALFSGKISAAIHLYFNAAIFIIPSIIITGLVFLGISQIIFFTSPYKE